MSYELHVANAIGGGLIGMHLAGSLGAIVGAVLGWLSIAVVYRLRGWKP